MNQDNNSDDLMNLFSSGAVLNVQSNISDDEPSGLEVNANNQSNMESVSPTINSLPNNSVFESSTTNSEVQTNITDTVVISLTTSNVLNVDTEQSQVSVVSDSENTATSSSLEENNTNESTNNLTNGPMPELEEIDDNELLISFVGKNADKILNKRFNFSGFFFSFFYMFYRKMFLYGLSVFIINLIVLNVYYNPLIILLFNIAVGIEVNKIYQKHAKNKINSVKTNHPFGKMEDLKRECGIQGGTNGGFIFAGSIISVGFTFLLVIVLSMFGITNGFISMIKGVSSGENGVYSGVLIFDSDNKANELFSIAIPEKFEKNDSFDEYSYSSGEGTFDKCVFSFKPVAGFSDASNLITQMHDFYTTTAEVSNVLSVKYNGIEWSYFSGDFISYSYYYATSKDGKVYLFEYDIGEDADEECQNYREKIITSIKNK